jgi:hypothetical protein
MSVLEKQIPIIGTRTYSAINPLSHETELLFRAIFNCGNHINGFTNGSIRKAIFPDTFDDIKVRNKVTRILAKLRNDEKITSNFQAATSR